MLHRLRLRCLSSAVTPLLLGIATGVLTAAAPAHASSVAAPVAARSTRAPWLVTHASRSPVVAPARSLATMRAAALRTARALAPLGELRELSIDRFGDGDVVVRYGMLHEGLPVVGAGVAVREDRSARVLQSVSVAPRALPTTTPLVDAAAAARIVTRLGKVGASASDAHLVVYMLRGSGRLAWVVQPRVPEALATAPRWIVDARDGSLLDARDTVVHASARVYESNPVKSPAPVLRELAQAPTGAALANDFVRALNCVDRKTVKSLNVGGFSVNVHTCDLEATAVPGESGDYLYEPVDDPKKPESAEDPFSEVSMYYHATRAYELFRGLQGDAAAQVVSDKPLRVIANFRMPEGYETQDLAKIGNPDLPLVPFSNAFYAPAGQGLGDIFQQLYGFTAGALWFGQGPNRDYAYDGDVVYHELVHAVVERTLSLGGWAVDAQGAIDAPGAMNEGLADYFAAAFTGDPDVGEYASKDIAQNLEQIRTLDNDDRCPSHVAGQVHHDSTIFSGAMWQARMSLPEASRTAFDAAIYKAMRQNSGTVSPTFDELAKLFLAVLESDLPAGAAALTAAMTDHGVLPGCDRVVTIGAGAGHQAPRAVARLGGFAAPGTASFGGAAVAPGMFQYKVELPEGTKQVRFRFNVAPSQGGGGGVLGGGATPFTPHVLVKFGKAITWSGEDDALTHDADASGDAIDDAVSRSTAIVFDVPAGAKVAYLQLGNSGQSDGHYDNAAVELVAGEVADAGADPAPAEAAPAQTVEESSCACSTPGRRADGGGAAAAVALLAGLAVVTRARRRQS